MIYHEGPHGYGRCFFCRASGEVLTRIFIRNPFEFRIEFVIIKVIRYAILIGVGSSFLGLVPFFFLDESASEAGGNGLKLAGFRGWEWPLFGKALLPAALVHAHFGSNKQRQGRLFALAYFWATFLFFTLSASRRSYYLLPILPAGALLIAQMLAANTTPEGGDE